MFRQNGRPSAGIAIYQIPDANALDVATRVDAKLAELARSFPEGLDYSVPFNTTKFVKTSIGEVYKTLIEAGVLVLLVILVFLQNWRATLVPATTVPVTIIGAFAGMAALGFTSTSPPCSASCSRSASSSTTPSSSWRACRIISSAACPATTPRSRR